MSPVNQVNQSSTNTSTSQRSQASEVNPFLEAIRLPETSVIPEQQSQQLEQEDFFALLSQQLSMQDPFKPVDNDQMIAQMASFSTVDGIANLNSEVANLSSVMSSSQALQASGLVGQKVLVPTPIGNISAESPTLKSVVSTPSPMPSVAVRIQDEVGQLVRSFTVDASSGGNIEVEWDGLDNNGNPVPMGNYVISASGNIEGETQDLPVSTYAHVSSVSLGTASSGAILNLRGGMGILLTDVLAVSES